jgi:hypothetical protein
MDELETRAGFDQEERERIRRALRRYMTEHRIGTPTLQSQIINADAPRRRVIPLSTLQRFITGAHHTQDHHVALCHAFVSRLPYYGEGLDIAQFGEALALMFVLPPDDLARDGHARTPLPEIAGSYVVRAFGAREVAAAEFPGGPAEYALIEFEGRSNKGYLRVTETVSRLRMANAGSSSSDIDETHIIYEGVYLPLDWRGIVFLRNQLTRTPKVYWIKEQLGNSWPCGFAVEFPPDGYQPLLRSFNFVICPPA